jgi:hypothetical protein
LQNNAVQGHRTRAHGAYPYERGNLAGALLSNWPLFGFKFKAYENPESSSLRPGSHMIKSLISKLVV